MQQRSLKLSVLAVAVLSSFSTLVRAQETTENNEATLPAIQVRANADASAEGLSAPYAGGQVARGSRVGVLGQQDYMETPFTVTSYTQELIQNQQAASVGDVLLNDPAVRVARGFGNYQQLYMVRGLPIYSDDMSYNGLYGLLPRQYLSTEIIERVEVLRGANAFLNGAAPGGSGLGGAINIVPKRAGNEPITQVTVGTQSGGQGYVAADLGRRVADDRLGIRLNVARRDGNTAVDGASGELTVAAMGVDYREGRVRVSADVGYQDHRLKAAQPSFYVATPDVPKAPDASSAIAQPWTYSNEKDSFGTLRGEYDFSSNITGWAAFGVREGRESSSFANPTILNGNGDTSTYVLDTVREDSIQTGEVGLRGNFKTGSVSHKVSLSAMGYKAISKNAYGFSDFSGFPGNIFSPTHIDKPSTTFYTGGRMTNPLVTERLETSSVALADAMSFLNDKLMITVGGRYQYIDDTTYNYDTGVADPGTAKSAITPVGGIVYRITPAMSVYANYIEGLVKGDIVSASSGATNIGEALDPYKTRQVEAGLKFDTGRIGGAVGVYQSRRPVAGLQDDGRFDTVGHQRYRGLELSAYGEIVPSLKALGGVSLLDTDLDGKDGIGAPKTQANFGLEWAVSQIKGLSLDGRVIYTSSQYADAANTQKVPSWTRVDLGARYVMPLGEQVLTLRARVENVANRDYWASSGGYPGQGYLTLGAPRTYIVSASVDF
ncbi:TonB-dependent receptor [Uliginosibacterium sp. sgz301328]|uniref:TonB-dependent receptor n=1 Tax=Uliginosibacterium sp. sgz301328 TaxID=3243764 RepID=UPI00359F056F